MAPGSRAAPGRSVATTSGSTLIAILWVVLITVLFSLPLFKAGLPWDENFSWSLTNYTILWFAGIGIFFGGWWAISARKWFKGPVRMGTEEELAKIETSDSFLLPPDAGLRGA